MNKQIERHIKFIDMGIGLGKKQKKKLKLAKLVGTKTDLNRLYKKLMNK
jgi:hypothetical protein